MSDKFQWPMPSWLGDLPDVEAKVAKTRILLCLASAYCGERGNLSRLARRMNVPEQTVHSAADRGQVSPEMAIALETLLGREHFPRELFRPDLFTLPAE